MITVDLNDKHLKENMRAIMELREFGIYTDEQLQEMYDKQLEKDRNGEVKTDE